MTHLLPRTVDFRFQIDEHWHAVARGYHALATFCYRVIFDWFHRPAAERSLWRRPLTGGDAEFNWQNVQLDSSWHYAKDATDVDVSAMCVGLCCWFIGGHLVCDWRPCSKQTTTQTYTWQGRGASPIDRSTWAPAPCVSLIIAVAVNIDPFTSRSVDTAARAFVFFLKKEKVTSGRTNGFLGAFKFTDWLETWPDCTRLSGCTLAKIWTLLNDWLMSCEF